MRANPAIPGYGVDHAKGSEEWGDSSRGAVRIFLARHMDALVLDGWIRQK
jgi:hypothetical protein